MITFNRFLKALHWLLIKPITFYYNLDDLKEDATSFINPTDSGFLGLDIVAGDDWNPLDKEAEMPESPDFMGLSEQDWENAVAMLDKTTYENRFDQSTPLGDLTWERTPGDEEGMYDWAQTVTLNPEVQALFDKGLMMQNISADIGLTAGGQISDTFSTPFELDDFEGYREDIYDAMLERLETDINKDWQSRNAELYAGGIGRGTEAYGWEQTQRDRMLNDARLQAYRGATDQALRERGQSVKEALLQRNQPLNEYNAWRTGAQVDLPQFQGAPPVQAAPQSNYLGAGIEQGQYDLGGYNADIMQQNALTQGLFGLGAAYLSGGTSAFV